MNDTVGQLAASHQKYGDECIIGVVIGYGYIFLKKRLFIYFYIKAAILHTLRMLKISKSLIQ